jgi:hypothetical protein
VAAGVAIVAGLQLAPFFLWSPEQITGHAMLRDDAFFFAVIARNFHDVGFLTFDGTMPTNGVQPLWMAVLIVLRGVLPSVHPVSLVAAASAAVYVGFAFAITRWLVATRAFASLAPALVFTALVTLNADFQRWVVTGLETPLLLLLLTFWLTGVERGFAQRTGAAAVLAGVGVLCFFARTDLFWLSAVTFVGMAWSAPRVRAPVIAYALTTGLFVLPYLAWNAASHGGIMPISGRVKLFEMNAALPTLGDYFASIEWHGLFEAFGEVIPFGTEFPLAVQMAIALGVVGLALGGAIRDARREAPALPGWLHMLVFAAAAHLVFLYVFYRELRPYSSYYFVAEIVACALVLAARAEALWPERRSALVTAAVAFLAVSNAERFATLDPVPYWETNLVVARNLDALPEDTAIGAYWPGVLGAFMERPVIPLDGILGSGEFFERYIRTGNELDYLLQDRPDSATRPNALLALYLHRSPETILAANTAPYRDQWNRLGESRIWEYRDCPLEVVDRYPVKTKGNGWYVFRLDPDEHRRCRERS